MDAELTRRFAKGESPFNGITLSEKEELPLTVFRETLDVVATILKGQPSQSIYSLDDWHFHDEYVSRGESYSWEEFDVEIASLGEDVIGPRDDFVYTAIFPEGREWYFRFLPQDEENAETKTWIATSGRFDLTGDAELIASVAGQLERLGVKVSRSDPEVFFHRP